ncbi:type II toxin-antitoxin system YafQ family toxin [Streptococcus henryi]|uniref:type II toxin-antitoxin system YafQ family toxin n=1 Tax=Streptococcus henryi TaxID=439219 RepID=UPI00037BA945|nr:type II toxin-antitoxin system YafQ family toxin [Streptococcus henryi]
MNIERTNQFLKDYKRLKKKHYDLTKLRHVIDLIVNGEREILYHQYKNHYLQGKYKSYQECHIEPDWLLIYKIHGKQLTLVLTRTGSHDDLFK